MAVPRAVVKSKMQFFEDSYNANKPGDCATLYAPKCLVTVNDGAVFKGETPAKVSVKKLIKKN